MSSSLPHGLLTGQLPPLGALWPERVAAERRGAALALRLTMPETQAALPPAQGVPKTEIVEAEDVSVWAFETSWA